MFGTSSQNLIAAAWAAVLSEVFQTWYMGPVEQDDDDDDDEAQHQRSDAHAYTPILAGVLLLLIVPSYFVGNVFPLPVGNVDEATTFGVGCINPTVQRYKHNKPTLKDYIDETKKLQNRAKFLLWPEGAVTFDSDADRDAAFENIRANISGAYVGVSFEQYMPDPNDESGRRSLKKNAIAVIGKDNKEPYLTYYKRHLVPSEYSPSS
jgi:apolipoprotein N-acyltransferase